MIYRSLGNVRVADGSVIAGPTRAGLMSTVAKVLKFSSQNIFQVYAIAERAATMILTDNAPIPAAKLQR